jgi:hypothetical protein
MFLEVRRDGRFVKCFAGLYFGASLESTGIEGGRMKDGYDECRRPREEAIGLGKRSIDVAVARLFGWLQER